MFCQTKSTFNWLVSLNTLLKTERKKQNSQFKIFLHTSNKGNLGDSDKMVNSSE